MKELSDLNHTYVKLDNGSEVIILDNGAVINAESDAMLQALHSRSTGGFKHHLEILIKKGSEEFMKSFYVGYGHKSIGDCGSTTIFVENVSMLVAKAIQDHPLYSGQESSTRYIDFSKQKFIDPTQSQRGLDLLEKQREFYLSAQEPTRDALKKMNPIHDGEKEEVYEKAINARTFDIIRSLLPAGASTNLAWHTNLRQAADKNLFLRHHPLDEVKKVSEGLEKALVIHHPNSFGHKRYSETEVYQEAIAERYLYHNQNSPIEPVLDFSRIDFNELNEYWELFDKRPPKTDLPKFLATCGEIKAEFQLDFGSFRDIQRHRAINQRMPLLTTELGFNEWYIENLPQKIREKLSNHLKYINKEINQFNLSQAESQYFMPMGYNTSNKFTGDLPATIYMVELRDSRFVHPTLQKVAHSMVNQIRGTLKIPIYVDSEPGRFDIKRGEQDIYLK
jgi:thymidylate synthase ThyX